MRIAVVTGHFPTISQTFVLNQVTGLIDAGHEVTVIASPPLEDEALHPAVEEYGLMEKVHYWAGDPSDETSAAGALLGAARTAKPKRLIRALRTSRQAIRRGGDKWNAEIVARAVRTAPLPEFDAIVCHFGTLGRKCQMLRDMGALRGPLATIFHGYDMSLFLKKRGEDVYDRLFERGQLFLPISEFWRERLIGMGAPSAKTVVHRMGVDPGRFRFGERQPGKGGEIKILSIARMVEKKGLSYGLRAFARVVADFPQARYTLIGDGPLRHDLEGLVHELGIPENVDFTGWRDRDEVQQALQEHQILMVPSVTAENGDMEGLPVVLMEGLATGIPVVSTRHSGIPELVRHGQSGLLARERDVDGLEEHLRTLLENTDFWSGYGRRGRAIVEDEFNISKLNHRLIELLEQRFGDK
jgi:colanic acid/amylovoran biosynthesis glycosyltransferase